MRHVSLIRAIVTVLVASLLLGGSALSQSLTSPPDGITVIGMGQASATPDLTMIQVTLSGAEMGGPPMLQPGATPGAAERQAIEPVVDALMDAGITESGMNVVVTPFIGNPYSGMYGPVSAFIEVTIDDPNSDRIASVMNAVTIGAAESRMPPPGFNVLHQIDDCSNLQMEARQAAFDDATRLATVEAEIVGVTLGDVTAVRDSMSVPTFSTDPFMGYSADGSCTFSGTANVYGPFGPMPYDMSDDPVVTVYAATEVTFSIQGAATPES